MTKKRGNSEGSVYKTKSGLWRGAYIVHTAEGMKRRYLSARTREEAATKLTRAMADRDGGLVFDAGKTSLGEYLDRYPHDVSRHPRKDAGGLGGVVGRRQSIMRVVVPFESEE